MSNVVDRYMQNDIAGVEKLLREVIGALSEPSSAVGGGGAVQQLVAHVVTELLLQTARPGAVHVKQLHSYPDWMEWRDTNCGAKFQNGPAAGHITLTNIRALRP